MDFPIVLALSFANPALLWGLVAASLPIIIHLLNRRKFREVQWAAMRFLLAAIQKNSRRIRVENWVLLAIRTLVILLVVSAMAKPFLESLGALPIIAGQRTHHVLVLDGSLSMAYSTGETTRWEQAKALAKQLVKDTRRGDAVSVVLMADPPRIFIKDPSPNHSEVLKEIEGITLPHGGTDLAASFAAIDRVLEASPITQKEVVFLTDLQAASWRKPEGDKDEGLKRAVANLSQRKTRSVVIDLGKAGDINRAVTELGLTPPIVTVGNSTLIRAVVRNFAPEKAEGVHVRLIVDGRLGPEETVDLPVGEDQAVVFRHTFGTSGDHDVEVRIDDDPLPLDNHRWQAVPVREFLNVLLVDGHFKPEAFEAETDFLAAALNPASDSTGAPSAIRTTVVAESQLSRLELASFDTVVLCNIAQFTESEVNSLDDYLKQGGGVVVFGGDQVVRENYNRLLYADGKGLLPAAIGANVGDASKKNESAFGFAPLGYRHPIIEEFANVPESVQASLTGTRIYEYQKLTLPKGSRAKVALGFETGDPAVIEIPRYRGTVIQVATSADSGWTNWPAHPSYPPVMEKIVLEAAAGRLAERNVQVGQPLDQSLPASGASAAVTIVTPDKRSLTTKLKAEGGVSQLHFEDTEISGPYQVKVGPPLALESLFAANPNPAESDPTKLDQAGLAAAVPGWNFAYMTNWKELSHNAGAVSRRGELHRPFLYGVLVLLLLESVLAWIFGHHASRA
ncbi:BatA domain-containing protein [Singulisphaera acidiphila]|uniref:N-terminal double-transmembrane domain-containing protein n=1 Tax=Singulisphaera acidiphila (strain ATCC BAA-1392 / DSM 18658 / VKM B-2454 / MOB10) TaxID=886293 RepID=L0DBI8_SINAD|nr:BatA domain-containing protein [Singulisphaera acidiphila]AGA26203.1 N-terminal double-transmembrane domain-containing protein [Singulisphaera acidiphila DSM 18658]